MKKIDMYREKLKSTVDWQPFLLQESGLPGPRGNLELAEAVALEGNEDLFNVFIGLDDITNAGSPQEFLTFCGIFGIGKLLAKGRTEYFQMLREFSRDQRWRVRESVAIALQFLGDEDMGLLLNEMRAWSKGSFLEKRAVIAALCEPRLLKDRDNVVQVLNLLDEITHSIIQANDRKSDEFQTLKKSLGYCWSVAVSSLPAEGKSFMEKWMKSSDKDIVWIMKENLKKNRLIKIDPEWVEQQMGQLVKY